MGEHDLAAIARAIIDSNRYMVLWTADAAGRPWVSPVYYAPEGYTRFLWVSAPEATHSRNLEPRPELAIVIFDSQVAIGEGQAVYMRATAQQLSGADLERGIEVFSRVSQAHGAPAWTAADVDAPAPHRLYRAVASEHSVLEPGRGDRRTPVVP